MWTTQKLQEYTMPLAKTDNNKIMRVIVFELWTKVIISDVAIYIILDMFMNIIKFIQVVFQSMCISRALNLLLMLSGYRI